MVIWYMEINRHQVESKNLFHLILDRENVIFCGVLILDILGSFFGMPGIELPGPGSCSRNLRDSIKDRKNLLYLGGQ